ncbi:hypothetical protein LUZ61_001994 [Rhynchospora tenuis]|uniref:Uncharacterized protein n=1 Tax=Rhynchospora tenuis TaxID=198213 RepID=A0AAD6ERC7_9POAL|nr:hypothetical protein LUZ61_001994 [Rhynchospora tenuis]
MSNYIDIDSSSEDSDDDLQIGFVESAPQSDALWAASQASHVGQPSNKHRILPSSFTNGHGNGALSSSSSTYSSARKPDANPSPLYHGHGGPGTRVLPSSLIGINKGKHVSPVGIGNVRFSNGVGTTMADSIARLPTGRPILPRPFITSHSKPAASYYEDDVQIIGNRTTTPNSVRVLPPSMGFRGIPDGVDLPSVSTFDERRGADLDESVIYQEALQNLSQPKLEEDLVEGILSVPLLKHQKIALAWMVQKEQSTHCAGGILADDQGLGKTVSTIALIEKQMEEQVRYTSSNQKKSEPISEAFNLDEDEFTEPGTKSDNNGPVDPLEPDGPPSRQASTSQGGSSNVRPPAGTLVVCPASVLKQWANELTDKVTEAGKLSVLVYHGGTRTRNPEELTRYDVVVTTYTIVTNEVPKQNPKDATNDEDAEQKNLERHGVSPEFAGNSKKRKLPAANKKKKGKKVKDSDLDSLDAGPLARVRWFRVVLDEAQSIKNHRTLVARACSGLRAKRRWCLSGTPIQNSIDDLYSYFRFLKYEPYSNYSKFCSSIKHLISRDSSNGYKKLQAVLKTLLLRRTKDTLINGQPIINLPPKTIGLNKVEFSPEERAFYVRLEERSRQQFKEYAAAGTLKQNYANILLLLLRLRQACDHPLLAQGYQSDTAGRDSFDIARQLPWDLIVNLYHRLEGSSAICGICSDPPEDAVVTMCGHVFCYQCVHERISSDETTCPSTGCRDSLSTNSIFSKSTLKACVSGKAGPSGSSTSPDPFSDEQQASISNSGYISSKIKAAVDVLIQVCGESDNAGPFKAIVFSQWTSMLDLLELSLNQYMIQYRRLDGTMTLVARDRAVKDFNTDPEVRVMLMSLKAGNLGLNMVAACHVILLDLWWNPYAEDQAIDRAHRIGQTRPVTVSRLTVQDTVEDRILALQEEKRTMVSSAFGDDNGGGRATRLTMEDLRYLFAV